MAPEKSASMTSVPELNVDQLDVDAGAEGLLEEAGLDADDRRGVGHVREVPEAQRGRLAIAGGRPGGRLGAPWTVSADTGVLVVPARGGDEHEAGDAAAASDETIPAKSDRHSRLSTWRNTLLQRGMLGIVRSGSQSVERALAVLRCLAAADDDLGVSDVAVRTELSNSTAHRLLQALRSDGLVAQDPRTDRYHLGPGLVALGRRAEARVRFDRLQPHLDALAAASGESVSLGTRVGDEVLIVLHVDSPQPLRFDQAPGTHVPVHASGIGKALLAFADDPAAEVAALGELVAFTPVTLTTPDALLADLERDSPARLGVERRRAPRRRAHDGRAPARRRRPAMGRRGDPGSDDPAVRRPPRRARRPAANRGRIDGPGAVASSVVNPPAWHLAELNVARLRQAARPPRDRRVRRRPRRDQRPGGVVARLRVAAHRRQRALVELRARRRRPAGHHQPVRVDVARTTSTTSCSTPPTRRSCAAGGSGSRGWPRPSSCAGGCRPGTSRPSRSRSIASPGSAATASATTPSRSVTVVPRR